MRDSVIRQCGFVALAKRMVLALFILASSVCVSVASAEQTANSDKLFELVLIRDKAEAGDSEAQFELGRRYLQGAGLERNDAMALHWVRQSAEQGYTRAEAGLGWMYAVGRGIKRDDSLSFYWYEKAANAGYPVAQRMLGKYYEKGIGTERNLDKARHWYQLAASQGDEKASRHLQQLLHSDESATTIPTASE